MIAAPTEQPNGTVFWITRRPDIFWEQCAPCEEVLAGPFLNQCDAFGMVRIVRSWMATVDPVAATRPMGVLALRPTLTDRPDIHPRFERSNGECIIHDGGTRIPARWILAHAGERRESLEGLRSPGF